MKREDYYDVVRSEPFSPQFWRDVLAEFVATSMLVTVQCFVPLSHGNPGYGGPVEVALAVGFIVCVMGWTVDEFGGGHMNPAVTFSMALRYRITVVRAAAYIVAQCLGAICGAAFVYGVTPAKHRATLAATVLGSDISSWQGFLVEAVITFILVMTVFGATNTNRKNDLYMPTIPIGFAISLGIMSGFAYTGGSMNPARSLGPAVVMNIWDNHWVYWLGPFAGGGLAGLVYSIFDRVGYPVSGRRISCSDVKHVVKVGDGGSSEVNKQVTAFPASSPAFGSTTSQVTKGDSPGGTQANTQVDVP